MEDLSFKPGSKLQERDFFTVNGCFIRGPDYLLFCGDKYMHKFDMVSGKFKVLEKQK